MMELEMAKNVSSMKFLDSQDAIPDFTIMGSSENGLKEK
jgi:hypothetical protein